MFAARGARILRGGAFKPRSSPYAFQGLGLEGLKLLAHAREESGLAIVTEVMSEDDVPLVAEYADILQIGTRNMENYCAARSGGALRPADSAQARHGRHHRRFSALGPDAFSTTAIPTSFSASAASAPLRPPLRNTFDVAAIALLKQISHLPVIADPSHAAGHRDLVPALARIAVAAEADGLLVEVHPNPDKAWSDGEQTLDFAAFDDMMASLEPYIALRAAQPAGVGACRRRVAGGRWMRPVTRCRMRRPCLFILVVLLCGFSGQHAERPGRSRSSSQPRPFTSHWRHLRGAERFPKGAQLLLVQDGKAEPLVAGFAATADANVSFDAKTVLFAGKKAASDPWQIWELTLADRSVRKVICRRYRRDSPLLSARRPPGLCAPRAAGIST